MHCFDVKNILRKIHANENFDVQFVSPAVSVCIATQATGKKVSPDQVNFSEQALSYAKNIGLHAALNGHEFQPNHAGRVGHTYSPVTKLASAAAVDQCNEFINNVFFENLSGEFDSLLNRLSNVVGELHDNVASHAAGIGFSCAQVYNSPSGTKIEFAVGDNGRGMRRNVSAFLNRKDISSVDAICWCVEQGNTTWVPADEMAQKDEMDALYSGYPANVPTFTDRNHHMGIGLARLKELVAICRGRLWIMSGDGEFFMENGEIKKQTLRDMNWPGVIIELELIAENANNISDSEFKSYEQLGRRLGI